MGIVSFLIYSKEYGLIRLVHTVKELTEIINSVKWAKVEVWKNGQCQNTLLKSHENVDIIHYAKMYV